MQRQHPRGVAHAPRRGQRLLHVLDLTGTWQEDQHTLAALEARVLAEGAGRVSRREVERGAEAAAADEPRYEVDDELDVDHLGVELRECAPRVASHVRVAARALTVAFG